MSDSLDETAAMDAIVIHFSKVFFSSPHYRLLKKVAASGLDSREVALIGIYQIDRSERVIIGRHYSEEDRVT